MIAQQTLVNFPEFANSGTKIAPDGAKYAEGFQPGDVLPAEWTNYLFNKASAGLTTSNSVVDSSQKELQNVVTQAGLTPSGIDNTQVYEAIKSFILNNTLSIMCTTAADAAPAVTGYGFITQYANNLHVRVTFKNGCYAESDTALTFSLNSLGARKIFIAKEGTVSQLKAVNINRGTGAKYWFMQPYVTLEMTYDTTLDNNNGGWLITNNPVVLSNTDANSGYTIYADGRKEYKYVHQESITSAKNITITFPFSFSTRPVIEATTISGSDANLARSIISSNASYTTESCRIWCRDCEGFSFFSTGY